mmetsp:Transcript_59486/g.145694  ORF Transcript_59486/g.145694 Transcript_59486/m.145694 type:complete len:194 (-) Transcript_59486:384-965(-)
MSVRSTQHSNSLHFPSNFNLLAATWPTMTAGCTTVKVFTSLTTILSFCILLLSAPSSSVSAFTVVVGPTSSSSSSLLASRTAAKSTAVVLNMSSSSSTQTQKPEIEVVSQPSQEFLETKGIFSWGIWGCPASTFPWSYSENESCYLLKGTVMVTPTDGRQPVTFGKGDFVTFPAGMSCTWDVTEAVEKHFNFF